MIYIQPEIKEEKRFIKPDDSELIYHDDWKEFSDMSKRPFNYNRFCSPEDYQFFGIPELKGEGKLIGGDFVFCTKCYKQYNVDVTCADATHWKACDCR